MWAKEIKTKYENLKDYDVYPVIGELDFKAENLNVLEVKDKIEDRVIGKAYLAGEKEIKQALEVAKNSKFTQKVMMKFIKF